MRSINTKNKKKKYKALILDVDGTLIPNRKDGMPSQKVKNAIAKASKLIHVGVATSRPYFMISHVVNHLKLSGPSITSGGARIIDISSQEILFEKTISLQSILGLHQILKKYKLPFIVNDADIEMEFSTQYVPKKPLGIWTLAVPPFMVDELAKEISTIPEVSVHKLPSWTKGQITLTIGHISATKQHAIWEVAKILGINTHEIIGVGDAGNDMPLLMACGLKVAMGNAVEDLKAIADYIAPSVENDGVADVIEKFVL